MDPALCEMLEGAPEEEIEAIIRLRQKGGAPPGVRLVAKFGEEIATCRLLRSNIRAVREDEEVVSLKAARLVTRDQEILPLSPGRIARDEILPTDVRRPASLRETGRGVVLGVADWGCDFAYPSFRNADGSTRLLALWDQSAPYHPEFPNRYGYGRIYTAQEINRALASQDPYAALPYHHADSDIDGDGAHATHVLDIAAGNGRNGGPVGIAPEAELAFVHLTAKGTEGLATLGDSVRLLEAVDFIVQTAGNLPWVINLSMGREGGPHDASTLVEQGFDALLASVQGGAISQSAGNYFNQRTHTRGRLRADESTTLTIEVDEADKTPNEIEVWYSGQDVFVVEVSAPDGTRFPPVALGERASLTLEGREVGRVYHRAHDPNNHDHHLDIFLYPGGPGGLWELKLTGVRINNGVFHAWIERDAGCQHCQARFPEEESDSSTTSGTICNGFLTISVGAYDPHSSRHEITPFSSAGPTRDGRQNPHLLAPGMSILAARSATREGEEETPLLTEKSGTSMASPHVAGTLACMFEAAGRPLRIEETRELLLSSARPTALPDHENIRAGRGYLDVERAVNAASNFSRVEKYPASETMPVAEEQSQSAVSSYASPETDEMDDVSISGEPIIETGGESKLEDEAIMCTCMNREDRPTEEFGDELPLVEDDQRVEATEILESEYGEEPFYEVFPEAVRNFGAELVELADEAIYGGKVLHSPDALIERILSEAGMTEPLTPLGAGNFPSEAEFFDAFAPGGSPALRRHYERFFEVVTLPGQRLLENLQPGDLLVTRALGEGRLAHSALIATGEILRDGQLALSGLRPESRLPGQYSQIVEAGAFPHGLRESYARRLADQQGRLRHDSLILRIRPATSRTGRAHVEMSENDAEVVERFSNVEFLDIAEWTDVSHFVETVRQAAPGAPHRYVEREILDSAQFRPFPDLTTLNLMRPVPGAVAPGARNYQFLLKSRVYYPRGAVNHLAGARAFPVVIIVHGNHGWKCLDTAHGQAQTEIMNHLGYEYLQEELARHGIVSMSINTNQANMLGSEVRTRAEFVLANLRILNRLNGTAGHRFHGRLDLHQIGLVGHSRGGDAVVKAVELNRPNSATFTIRAVCSIAPTDITAELHDVPSVPAVPASPGVAAVAAVPAHVDRAISSDWISLRQTDHLRYLVLYGSKDGDPSGVNGSGTGFRHYDRATCDRTMIFVRDIAHNRFNTVWDNLRNYGDPFHRFVRHPDCRTHSPNVSTSLSSCGPYRTVGPNCPPFDSDIRSADDHKQLVKEYVGGLLRLDLNGEASRLDLFNGLIVPTRNHTVSIQWMFTNMLEIENFDDPAHNSLLGPSVHTGTSRILFRRGPALPLSAVPHETWALQATTSGGIYRSEIPPARKNFSAFTFLSLRLTNQYNITSPQTISSSPHQNFKVRIFFERTTGGITFAEVNQTHIDKRGVRDRNRPFFHQIEFDAAPAGSTRTENVTKICLDTLVIPLRHFQGVNWPEVRAIEFEAGPSLTSTIFMDSLAVG